MRVNVVIEVEKEKLRETVEQLKKEKGFERDEGYEVVLPSGKILIRGTVDNDIQGGYWSDPGIAPYGPVQ